MIKPRRVAAAVAVLFGAALVSADPATPAYAANSSYATVHAASAGWKYYATYPDKASCETAGGTQSRNWQCVSNSGAHDLYLWY